MNIETLFEKSDFHAIVFQKYLLASGQISTDAIFSAPQFRNDVSFIKDKIFVFLLKPLLDICDCYMRIDNFATMSVNFIFVLKKSVLPEISTVNAKPTTKTFNLSHLSEQILEQYEQDIHSQNVKKCVDYLRSGYVFTNENDFYEDLASKAKMLCPYSVHKISLDLFNVARIICPEWGKYVKQVVSDAKQAIQEEAKKQACEYDNINKSICETNIYWDDATDTFPRYVDFVNKVVYDNINRLNRDMSPETVRKMVNSSDKFFMFKTKKTEVDNNEIRVSLGPSHFLITHANGKLSILENGEQMKYLSSKKTSFLNKYIRTLVLPKREVYVDNNYKINGEDEHIKVIYLPKASEVFAKAIYSQRYKNLKIALELFKFTEFKEQKILLESVIHSMVNAIEMYIINTKLLDFLKEYHKKESFWSKIVNSFIAGWNERDLQAEVTEQHSKVENISSNILKLGQSQNNGDKSVGPKKASDYDPVQTVVNIIKNDLRGKEIRQILGKSDLTIDVKTNRILSLYDEDIGATSKAIISKNEKLQADFIAKIKPLVSIK